MPRRKSGGKQVYGATVAPYKAEKKGLKAKAASTEIPKRGPGRPKGSKNKKLDASAEARPVEKGQGAKPGRKPGPKAVQEVQPQDFEAVVQKDAKALEEALWGIDRFRAMLEVCRDYKLTSFSFDNVSATFSETSWTKAETPKAPTPEVRAGGFTGAAIGRAHGIAAPAQTRHDQQEALEEHMDQLLITDPKAYEELLMDERPDGLS